MKRWTLPLLFALGLASSTVSAAVEITDLATLGGEWSMALDINDYDQVIGESSLSGDQEVHICLYENGCLVDISRLYGLGPPANYTAWGNAINNRGQIAANISNGHAAILSRGQVFDLGLGGDYSTSLDMNDFGQTVGYYSSDGLQRAFSYNHGTVTLLGSNGPQAISFATGINNSGVVVGCAADSYTIPDHAFIYSNGVTTNLTPFGNSESYALGINNIGQVVGEYYDVKRAAFHAFIYKEGVFTDIGDAESPQTIAYGINDSGQIVGTTLVLRNNSCRDCNDYEPHAFFYENGVLTDLNTLLPSNSEWELMEAYAVNNKGKIVGYGLIHGQRHAFLLQLIFPSAQMPRHTH
jgi:probable HAF family extracellular repeat protein